MKFAFKAFIFTLVFFASMELVGQEKAPATKTPPVISDSILKDFFKAQAEFIAAQASAAKAQELLQQKDVALRASQSAIEKVCGEDFQPQMTKDNDPVCVAKPKMPAAPKIPAKK